MTTISRRSEWVVPSLLILLSMVPAVAGTARLAELVSDAEVTEANARFFAQPLPVVLHILAVIPYSILGAGILNSSMIVLGYAFSRSIDTAARYAGRGAFLLGSLVALTVGSVWLYRRLRDEGGRRAAVRWMESHAVLRWLVVLARRFQPQLRFLWNRVTPGGTFGLELTSLMAMLAVLALLKLFTNPLVLGSGTGDARSYLEVARHVAAGDGLVSSASMWYMGLDPLPHKTPLYPLWPLVLGFSARVIPLDSAAALLPELLYLVSLALLYALTRRLARAASAPARRRSLA